MIRKVNTMAMITHDEAFHLEMLVRKVFRCSRFGAMGIADADHLEYHPFDAALVTLAPLCTNNRQYDDIDDFIDRYGCYFQFPDEYVYEQHRVESFIEELKSLIDRFYN